MTNLSVYQNRKLEGKIKSCQKNSRLDLQNQKLTDSDIEIIIEEGIINKQCTMLWLSDNQITSQGISKLTTILNTNSTLEGLSMSHNNITDAGVFYLTKSLSNKTSYLKRLALTGNNLTDQSAEYLSQMLQINQTLSQLWLGYNKITDYGLKLFMNVLINHNKTLHILSLAWNDLITDLSIDSIIDMLDTNQTLKLLSLSNCKISLTNKIKLQQAANLHTEFYLDI